MADSNILVIGDVALECGVAVSPATRISSNDISIELGKPLHQEGHFVCQNGAAWKIAEYLSHRRGASTFDCIPALPSKAFATDQPQLFVTFKRFTSQMKWNAKPKAWLATDSQQTYRIESLIARCLAGPQFFQKLTEEFRSPASEGLFQHCGVLLICNRQLGFRAAASTTPLGSTLKRNLALITPHAWSVLETTDPVDTLHDSLLKLIPNEHLARTVIVMSSNSLKSSGIIVRDDLSLERSVEDFVTAVFSSRNRLLNDPKEVLKAIWGVKCYVVRLGSRAAIVWIPKSPKIKATREEDESENESLYDIGTVRLVYGNDPYEPQSGPAADSSDLGKMYGDTSILASEIAIALQKLPTSFDEELLSNSIESACATGLAVCQQYFRMGLGQSYTEFRSVFSRLFQGDSVEIMKKQTFHSISGKNAQKLPKDWTILSEVTTPQRSYTPFLGPSAATTSQSGDTAIRVVQEGIDVLRGAGIPFVKHIDLCTADRNEIENYAGIANLVTKYMKNPSWSKPLCLGVFGPPGCGKSFGIAQVVQAVTGYLTSISTSAMTFNLSQLSSVKELAKAFHSVRNAGLASKLPLVFIDEFDSTFDEQEFGWLKYLLAPMQDGVFIDDDESYHLPRCILVFIGGQNRDFIEFEGRQRDKNFIAAKGRDFISRLRHYLVVKGPDLPGPGDKPAIEELTDDIARYLSEDKIDRPGRRLRRAILLRSVLEKSLPDIIQEEISINNQIIKRANIDVSVIEAFLGIRAYKHGSRSLEAIVDMSRDSITRKSFQKSSLPPEEQLELHVDAEEFMNIVVRVGE